MFGVVRNRLGLLRISSGARTWYMVTPSRFRTVLRGRFGTSFMTVNIMTSGKRARPRGKAVSMMLGTTKMKIRSQEQLFGSILGVLSRVGTPQRNPVGNVRIGTPRGLGMPG